MKTHNSRRGQAVVIVLLIIIILAGVGWYFFGTKSTTTHIIVEQSAPENIAISSEPPDDTDSKTTSLTTPDTAQMTAENTTAITPEAGEEDLFNKYASEFKAPQINSHITVKLTNGNIIKGVLKVFDDKKLYIETTTGTGAAIVSILREQIAPEIQPYYFRNAYADMMIKKTANPHVP